MFVHICTSKLRSWSVFFFGRLNNSSAITIPIKEMTTFVAPFVLLKKWSPHAFMIIHVFVLIILWLGYGFVLSLYHISVSIVFSVVFSLSEKQVFVYFFPYKTRRLILFYGVLPNEITRTSLSFKIYFTNFPSVIIGTKYAFCMHYVEKRCFLFRPFNSNLQLFPKR